MDLFFHTKMQVWTLIDAGTELVRRIANKMQAPGIGGFGGLYPLGKSFRDSRVLIILGCIKMSHCLHIHGI